MRAPGTLERPRIRGPLPPDRDGFAGEPGQNGQAAAPRPFNPAQVAVWLLVGAVTILFAAFSIAYLSRRHAADWSVGPIPPMLWVNTAVLLMSSATMEWTRASARWDIGEVRSALTATTLLGVGFLVGQVFAWRELVAAGVYLATNPHSAFFYLFTGTHALHLVGGVGGLLYTLRKVRGLHEGADAASLVGPLATYWHFVDALWLYLFLILFWI